MTRTILSSLAVVAMFATSAGPAASQADLGGQQPVPCDCTNCSAEHCPRRAATSMEGAPLSSAGQWIPDQPTVPGSLASPLETKPQGQR